MDRLNLWSQGSWAGCVSGAGTDGNVTVSEKQVTAIRNAFMRRMGGSDQFLTGLVFLLTVYVSSIIDHRLIVTGLSVPSSTAPERSLSRLTPPRYSLENPDIRKG